MIALWTTWRHFIPGRGSRLKLNAKIIINGNEFNNAGEMSVDDRHLYHEALQALFPPDIVVSAAEPAEISRKKKLSIVVAVRSCLCRAARLLRLKRWAGRGATSRFRAHRANALSGRD